MRRNVNFLQANCTSSPKGKQEEAFAKELLPGQCLLTVPQDKPFLDWAGFGQPPAANVWLHGFVLYNKETKAPKNSSLVWPSLLWSPFSKNSRLWMTSVGVRNMPKGIGLEHGLVYCAGVVCTICRDATNVFQPGWLQHLLLSVSQGIPASQLAQSVEDDVSHLVVNARTCRAGSIPRYIKPTFVVQAAAT
jgi:hypothetical protein